MQMAYSQNSIGLDSLLKEEKRLKNIILNSDQSFYDSLLFETYQKIWEITSFNDIRLSCEYAIKMRDLSNKTANKSQRLRAYLNLGISYDNLSEYTNAIDSYSKLRLLSIFYRDTLYLAYSYLNEAIVLSKISRFEEALSFNKRALFLLKRKNSRYEEVVSVLNNMGILYKKLKRYGRAKECYREGLQILKQNNDMYFSSFLENNLASLYLVTGDYTKARNFASKAINSSKFCEDKFLEAANLNLMANVLFAQKQMEAARKFYLQAIHLRDSIGDAQGLSESKIDYGKFLLEAGDLKTAEKFVQEGLRNMKSTGDHTILSKAFKTLTEINEKNGDFKNAYIHLKYHKKIEDSIFNADMLNKIAELDMRYNYEQKADSINLANENRISLIKEKNRADGLIRNAILLFALLIAIFLGILLYQKSKLSKLRNLKALESERFRISRDLHDGLGAGITGVLMLTQQLNPSMDSEKLFKIVNKVNVTLSELLGQLSDLVWTLNLNNESLSNLVNYFHKLSTELFEDSEIELKFELPQQFPDRKLLSIERRNLLMIFKESINNVLKHSKATEVIIRCEIRKTSCSIVIQDNGIGFNIDDKRSYGNGLKNAESRMREIGGSYHVKTEPGKGTLMQIDF
jgi:signal transduction histidine kinase